MGGEIELRKDFIGKGYYSKVRVQIKYHHDVTHLQPLTNVPTKYQLTTQYSFLDVAQEVFVGQGHYGKVKGQIRVTP